MPDHSHRKIPLVRPALPTFAIFFFKRLAAFSLLTILFLSNLIFSPEIRAASPASSTVVISQIYGGGGNSGAAFTNDFVELFNRGSSPVDLTGWSVQYAPAGSSSWSVTPLTSVTLGPGQFYLIRQAAGAGGTDPLPTPDATGAVQMSGTAGNVILADTTVQATGTDGVNLGAARVDAVSYGTGSNSLEGTPTGNLSNTTSARRISGGCQDTDNNGADFQIITAFQTNNPRNTSAAAVSCTSITDPTATGQANPGTVAPGEVSLLSVSVIPGTNPASTGLSVTADLSGIGGSAAQNLFDDGTNGDATGGDNVFSYLLTVPVAASTGAYNLSAIVADLEGRFAAANLPLNIVGPVDPLVHLTMGNPTGATTDVNQPGNYLLLRDQYAVSYHRDRGIPNWVSWHLDASWLGSTPRQDDFRSDPSLPAGWYQVKPTDYAGSGFDRGHLTPSADRTATVADNSSTFLMTNMMPQSPDNNQGPWEKLEDFGRTLAGQGNELYIIAGSVGAGGTGSNGTVSTIAGGQVTVPAYTWKVILVLPTGDDDVMRVTAATRAIAVIIPNTQGIRNDPWQKYLATVDQVEALTGFDFFSNVSPSIQTEFESRLDPASNTSPPTVTGGTYGDLWITGPNTTLTGDITVTGTLNLAGSKLSTDGFKITFAPNASVSRMSGYVIGRVEKQFDSVAPSAVFEFPVGTANGYSPVTANPTALGLTPSSLTVSAEQTAHPNAPNPNAALGRYWTLTETGDLAADLTFQYLDADVPAGVSNETSFRLQKYESGAFTQIPAVIDDTANTASTAGVDQFSDWTLIAQFGPTSARADISGRVIGLQNRGVAGALVTALDENGNRQYALTNPFGYYRFTGLSVGRLYLVEVKSKQYSFAPQFVNLLDDLRDLDFTAVAGNKGQLSN
ncbi:MAG: DNA/RNA non-specific endonuclease [Pyrinomonadaceae bacterium]